ncbi:hypothetical protein EDB85DRAFT_2153562 [Lactarius pseudohatsudake]|nr:hypothetical protein EDB85DRAFT_2153562 [Lactarius pseudohatsudake]
MAEYSESSTISPEVIKLASPLLFGTIFNWVLYGVLCVQIYVYSYNFPKDGRSIKFLVYFIFLVETIQTALTGADVYYWFVAGFGNVEHLGNSYFAPVDVIILTSVVSFIVQGYFCYRIWVLNSRSSWICWIIAVAAVTQSVASVWAVIKPIMLGKYVVTKTALYLWAISSALVDILIAVAMTLLLRRASGNFSSFVLVRVVRLTIETNALTATLAITTLVLYVAFPNELYCVYTVAIFGKVYSNTLLVSLNNRIYLRDRRSPEHGDNAVPDGARAIAETPLHFATPEHQPRALKNDIVIFFRSIISQLVDLDDNRSDGTSTALTGPWKCDLPPEDLEWTVGMLPHPYDRKDEVYRL